MSEKEEMICLHCERPIQRVRHGVSGVFPKFMWKTENGYYCVKAGGECQHSPAPLPTGKAGA